MPSVIEYVPPTLAGRNAFNQEITSERNRRINGYRTALKYYLGQHDPQLNVEEDDLDFNTIINLVQMTADRTTAFLFPDVPDIVLDPKAVEDTDEELWIKKVIEANGGLKTFSKWALRGFLAGHSFIRVKPAEEKLRNKAGHYPRIIVLDPTTVTVYWKADDVSDVVWYEMRYMVGETVYIQDFIKDEADERWLIKTYKEVGGKDQAFAGVRTNHGGVLGINLDRLNFGEGVYELVSTAVHTSLIPPIIETAHLPHPDDYYGLTDFTQKDLQDAINRVASERNRIVSENADPVDVITGADAEEVQDQGAVMTVPNERARVTRLELKGDLSGITGVLDKLIETYLAIARVVLLKGEAKDLQRVTNASVRTLFLDMLSKNKLLQNTYGESLRKMTHLLLEMGYEAKAIALNPATIEVSIKFGSALPVDETEIANINALALNGGYMGRREAATRLNMDWAEQQAFIQSDKEEDLADQEIQNEMTVELASKMPQPEKSDGKKPANKGFAS